MGVSILMLLGSCYYSMTSLRLMNGDGSRAMLNLLGNPHLYAEDPYLRWSNVLLQWPYLIIANLVNLKINEARNLIAFSFTTMPIFFLMFYGIQSLRLKCMRWLWATIGLTCVVYFPQAFNSFNTVVESSFLFLLYLFAQKHFSGYVKNIIQTILIASFVCSHELSLAYTGFIFIKPILDHYITYKRISFKFDLMSLLGLLASLAILIRYLRLPAVNHIDYRSHLLSYTENFDLMVVLSFLVLCYFVIARKKNQTYITCVAFIGLLVKASMSFYAIEFFHYSFRLLTPLLTLGWCLLFYYHPSFLDSKLVQVLLLVMLSSFSIKDMKLSERWTTNLNNFIEFSQDKPLCYTENNQAVMNNLRQYGYYDRVMGMHISLAMSPSYENPKLIFLPTKESAVFDPCKHISDYRIPYNEKEDNHFYFNQLFKFNWEVFDALGNSAP